MAKYSLNNLYNHFANANMCTTLADKLCSTHTSGPTTSKINPNRKSLAQLAKIVELMGTQRGATYSVGKNDLGNFVTVAGKIPTCSCNAKNDCEYNEWCTGNDYKPGTTGCYDNCGHCGSHNQWSCSCKWNDYCDCESYSPPYNNGGWCQNYKWNGTDYNSYCDALSVDACSAYGCLHSYGCNCQGDYCYCYSDLSSCSGNNKYSCGSNLTCTCYGESGCKTENICTNYTAGCGTKFCPNVYGAFN